jgi:restriction endonuclease Mrr
VSETCKINRLSAWHLPYSNIIEEIVYVQAKRYQQGDKIGPSSIRDFFGSLNMHKATKSLFVTTSEFSQAAIDTAD